MRRPAREGLSLSIRQSWFQRHTALERIAGYARTNPINTPHIRTKFGGFTDDILPQSTPADRTFICDSHSDQSQQHTPPDALPFRQHSTPSKRSRHIATCLGIDIGGTSVKASLIRNGAVIARGRSLPYHRPSTDELVRAIHEATRLDGHLAASTTVQAIGLCCPGVLNEATQEITVAVNVPGLVGVPLRELVRRGVMGGSGTHAQSSINLPAPVIIGDGFAATYDVWWTRRDREPALRRRMVSLVLGTGVGGCVLDDGKPLHVSGRSPGHLGQIDVGIEIDRGDGTREIPLGPDGGRGGLEAYLGLPALVKTYGDATPTASGGPSNLARAVAAWTPNDAPMRALARAIRICHALYRPDTVYLLGGVAMMLAPVADVLKSMVNTDLTSLARPGWTIRLGEHAWHAADGAARAAAGA